MLARRVSYSLHSLPAELPAVPRARAPSPWRTPGARNRRRGGAPAAACRHHRNPPVRPPRVGGTHFSIVSCLRRFLLKHFLTIIFYCCR